MIGSDIVTVPKQGQTLTDLGNKPISDLIGDDIYINTDGQVFGTIKEVKGWTEFDKKNGDGYFFPITLGEKYEGQEITFKGMDTKEKKATDREWVIKLSRGTESSFSFSTAEEPDFLKLTFEHATLVPQE